MVSPIIKMLSDKHSGVSGIATQLLVLHSGECPLRGGYAQSLTNWANVPLNQGGPEASWHWFVDPIAIVQMVLPEFYAWHASEANAMSEGFEQAGYARFTRAEWLTPEGLKQIDNLAWIMAQRAKANGIPARWLTTAEVEAVTKGGNRTIKGLCLHRQIDPETRTDPGDGYPYDLLLAQIKFHMGAGGTGTIAPSGTTTTSKEIFTVDQFETIMKEIKDQGVATRTYIGQLLVAGYTVGDQKFPGMSKVDITNQATIRATLALVTEMAKNPNMTPDQVTAAVDKALEDGTIDVKISVAGTKAPVPEDQPVS